jgi:hypothetical protein
MQAKQYNNTRTKMAAAHTYLSLMRKYKYLKLIISIL